MSNDDDDDDDDDIDNIPRVPRDVLRNPRVEHLHDELRDVGLYATIIYTPPPINVCSVYLK